MDNITRLVIITGFTGVGKTTFCQVVSEVSKFEDINTGYCLKKFMEAEGLKTQHKFEIGRSFLNTYGEETVFDVINGWIKPGGTYILDGIRLFSTYTLFKQNYEKVKTVFIDANELSRTKRYYEWLVKDGLDSDHALQIAMKQEEYYDELIKIRDSSEIIINNTGNLEELKFQAFAFGKNLSYSF
ncbi:hypothetical protein BEL04_05680 [Mucilaginibacter sp. PPCGB 2223]|uniref:hypothetical protein n=1 Tax=Mucilaginibacter sp. PPCGB 2223 TaxID=1886027 RepID=UPI00082628C9|nr:hypothetical protein [Mucilaginibacter sp. PPCGB 2223]OCX53777.1 hypothetical protein BEL04_05680 [Mucilaginibacter sp. PPCGB 2223]